MATAATPDRMMTVLLSDATGFFERWRIYRRARRSGGLFHGISS
jgi:hypothetical protein